MIQFFKLFETEFPAAKKNEEGLLNSELRKYTRYRPIIIVDMEKYT